MEKRFGNTLYLPRTVEWMTDNGSFYIAHSTRTRGLTRVYRVHDASPESNGIAESFERDYVYVNDLQEAMTVVGKLAEWMEDYKTGIPIKG